MVILELLKAFAIGVCASAPIGPTAILVLQKTLSGGRKVGFSTALGATVIDTTYSAIAVFAVTAVSDYIISHQTVFLIIGGLIVGGVGVSMALKKLNTESCGAVSAGNTLQAMLCAISNPGAIAVMLTLVALFKIDVDIAPVWAVVPCVALGSVTYWMIFTTLISRARRAVRTETLRKINRVAGIIVFLLGIVLIVRGIATL